MKRNVFLAACLFSGVAVGGLSGAENYVTYNVSAAKDTISRNIYGQFSEHLGHCIYGGLWVGKNSDIPNVDGIRTDVVDALKEIKVANLRWPGGCFASQYHWKDGIGPDAKRPSLINTNWGGVTEDNSFGTHEFLDLCSQLGCQPVFCGNLGSGTAQELSQWVEYVNSNNVSPMTDLRKKNGREKPWKVKYWDLGNESWGCGGNMTPQYYFDRARRFSTYMHNFNGTKLYKILVGPGGDDFIWTEDIMREYAKMNDGARKSLFSGMSFHYYTITHNWQHKGSATNFTKAEYFMTMDHTLKMKNIIETNERIMDKYDPKHELDMVVDEWGDWFDVEPGTNPGFLFQQNTVRDALVAAANLDIFNNHCDRVKVAAIAQMVNVLQSPILTKGKEMVKTPTFYVYKLYTVHHDATMIPSKVTCETLKNGDNSIPAISTSASIAKNGRIHITMSNFDPDHAQTVSCILKGKTSLAFDRGEIVTGAKINSYNHFGKPEEVNDQPFDGVKVDGNHVTITLPSKSVVMVELSGS